MIKNIRDECLAQCLPQSRLSINVFSNITPRHNSCQVIEGRLQININCVRTIQEFYVKLLFTLVSKTHSPKIRQVGFFSLLAVSFPTNILNFLFYFVGSPKSTSSLHTRGNNVNTRGSAVGCLFMFYIT